MTWNHNMIPPARKHTHNVWNTDFDFSNASGNNSITATSTIAPAANPNPRGKKYKNSATKANVGSAIIGCGILEHILHNTAPLGDTPFGTKTNATIKNVLDD